MKKFRAIVETSVEPQDHGVIWYYDGEFLHFKNGRWVSMIKRVEDDSDDIIIT